MRLCWVRRAPRAGVRALERFIRSPEVGELAAQMVRIVYRANAEDLVWKTGKEPDIKELLERFREVTGLDLSDDELYDLARKIYFEAIRRAK